MNQLILIKSIDARRRKLKIRRLKYTCQTKTNITISGGGDNEHLSGEKKRESVSNGDIAYHHETHKTNTSDGSTTAEISLSLTASSTSDNHHHLSSTNHVVLSGFQEKKSENSPSFARVLYGSVAVIGFRREMEDAVRVELGFMSKGGEKYDFFGVYDGHGGSQVAEACKERLHRVLVEEVTMKGKEGKDSSSIEWERVMEGCFERMDEEVKKDKMMGSTAVVAVVGKEELVVAHCGDSRAVISRAGIAVPLSVDHKPDRPEELERVEAAGGRVVNWDGHRVLGVLATSRSIGDRFLKPFVISKPDVTVNKRTENDEFLILASDGLWDVISNEAACRVVKRCLSGRMRRKSQQAVIESHAAEAAAVLVELAMAKGSTDNISVIVVDLKKHASFSC